MVRFFQEFNYNGVGGEIEYKNIDDWITTQYVRLEMPSGIDACLQMEFYGCPEGSYDFDFE